MLFSLNLSVSFAGVSAGKRQYPAAVLLAVAASTIVLTLTILQRADLSPSFAIRQRMMYQIKIRFRMILNRTLWVSVKVTARSPAACLASALHRQAAMFATYVLKVLMQSLGAAKVKGLEAARQVP